MDCVGCLHWKAWDRTGLDKFCLMNCVVGCLVGVLLHGGNLRRHDGVMHLCIYGLVS